MDLDPDDVAEAYYDTVRRLVPYAPVQLVNGLCVRGVLPVSRPEPAIRVVLGHLGEFDLTRSTAYEVPLRDGTEVRSARSIVRAVVRAAETRAAGGDGSGTVLGIPVVLVKGEALQARGGSYEEHSSRFLQVLMEPFVEVPPSPGVRGFLLTGPGRMRVYTKERGSPDVIGADVTVSCGMTALLAAIPSLVEERERWLDSDDPHCTYRMDLLQW